MKYLLGVGKVFEGNQGFDSGHHACLEYHCAFRVVKSSVCVGIRPFDCSGIQGELD